MRRIDTIEGVQPPDMLRDRVNETYATDRRPVDEIIITKFPHCNGACNCGMGAVWKTRFLALVACMIKARGRPLQVQEQHQNGGEGIHLTLEPHKPRNKPKSIPPGGIKIG